jgi:hypothetical protein
MDMMMMMNIRNPQIQNAELLIIEAGGAYIYH